MLSTSLMISTNAKERSLPVIVQIILSSLLIALCSQISIPLPFTPVPITMQTVAVMMIGGVLGSKKGALSVLFYLAESVMGLPVLAGGVINSFALIGPKGGYLIGFVFQAYLVGWFSERLSKIGKANLMLGIFLAYTIQLLFGALWLAQFVGFKHMFMMGVIPFIPGALVKILFVTKFLTRNGSVA